MSLDIIGVALSFEKISEFIEFERKCKMGGQVSLFNNQFNGYKLKITVADEFRFNDFLSFEKETTDFYISGHPLKHITKYKSVIGAINVSEIIDSSETGEISDGQSATVLVLVSAIKTRKSKNKKTYLTLRLEDLSGCISSIAFDTVLSYSKDALEVNGIYIIKGKVEIREEAPPEIICSGIKKFREEEYAAINTNEINEYNDASSVIVNISNDTDINRLTSVAKLYSGNLKLFAKKQSGEEVLIGSVSRSKNVVNSIFKIFGKELVKILN